MPNDLKIAFFGTPELSVWVLEELKKKNIVPSCVVTTPDRPSGRKLIPVASPVKRWAQEQKITVVEAGSLRDPLSVPQISNQDWDLFIVAAYNIILPKWLLAKPTKGTVNVHPSLLPKLRGPSPVRSAILLNERDAVGVSIMEIDEQIDHGPIFTQKAITTPEWPIQGRILDELLFRTGGEMLGEMIPSIIAGTATRQEQIHDKATYSKKFTKDDGLVDLSDDGYKNYLKFCAFDGWPGVFFFDKNGKRIKITQAHFENDTFIIDKVIPEGKNEIRYLDFIKIS